MTGHNVLPHLDSNQEPFGSWFGKYQTKGPLFVCTKPTKSVVLKKINMVGVSRGVAA
jgi:hypothetical protein